MPRLLLLFAVMIWGTTFVATKVILPYVSPPELLGLRMIIALPILLIITRVKKVRFDFTWKQHLNLLVGSAVITAHFLIQITGLKTATATNTGWIISVSPLALAVLSFLFLREKIGRAVILGITLATLGVVLLVSKGRLTEISWLESTGDWLVLVSAFTWAIFTVVTRDISRAGNPLAVTFAILLPTAVLMVAYMLINSDWSRFLALPADAIVALLFLAIFGTALGHWFWQTGVAKIGAAKAGIFLYLEPFTSTALGALYLKEQFGVFTAVGGLLVLLGVYVAERKNQ